MRGFGWALLLLGAAGLFWALNLDTTVGITPYYSDLKDRWVFPTDRYHNIGLLEDKHNYIVAAGVVAVVGVLLVIVGGSRAPAHAAEPAQGVAGVVPRLTKKCPDCTEIIKLDANVCRFCARQFTAQEVQAQIAHATSSVATATAGKARVTRHTAKRDTIALWVTCGGCLLFLLLTSLAGACSAFALIH